MLAERESLKRFLFVYLISTFLLLGVGEYIYYKNGVHRIVDNEVGYMSNQLKLFFTQNKMVGFRFHPQININGLDVKVYFNKNITNKEFWLKNNKVFYHYAMPRGWGKVDIVMSKKLDFESIHNLQKELLLFNFFAIIFIVGIAILLGKIFIQPMKKVVNDLESFIRDSTHEMNTPISIILSNIELLKLNGVENKNLNRIENSSKRLEKIFKDLTFIRLHHKRDKSIEKINLKEILLQRIEFFKTSIENKNLKLKLDLENKTIMMDKEDLIRLIDNILSNAIKYSPINSEITIKLKQYFMVKNKGKIENFKNIKNKFVRENKNEGGFGIGLYIVNKICKDYGIKFQIFSENEEIVVRMDDFDVSY